MKPHFKLMRSSFLYKHYEMLVLGALTLLILFKVLGES